MQSVYDSPFFEGVRIPVIREILAGLPVNTVRRGEVLIREGRTANKVYLVVSGEFRIESVRENGLHWIAAAVTGDVLGEAALMAGEKHSARVTARLQSEVIVFSKAQLQTVCDRFPVLWQNLLRIEARRLRQNHSIRRSSPSERMTIAHCCNYDATESLYIALNLAAGLARTTGKSVLFLFAGHAHSNAHSILMPDVSESDRLKKLKRLAASLGKSDIRGSVMKTRHSIDLLPFLDGKEYSRILKVNDLPRIVTAAAGMYEYIFIECGMTDTRSALQKLAIEQSDRILIGVDPLLYRVDSLVNANEKLRKIHPEFDLRTRFYLKRIHYAEDAADLSIRPSADWVRAAEIEERLKHAIDLSLSGSVHNRRHLGYPQLKIMSSRSSRLVHSLRSVARALADRRVGLALGGGGARALASLGVLRELERNRVHIDAIAGTSMGALIGALFAMGLDTHRIESSFRELLPDDSAVLDYGFPFLSFFRGRKMERLLRQIFGRTRIEDLQIPFTAVSADLITGKEVRIRRGLLWRAIRASMSIPVIFPPVKYRNSLLIDGAAVNNIPGDILNSMGMQYVLGVNVTPMYDNSLAEYIEGTNLYKLLRPDRDFFRRIYKFFSLLDLTVRRPPVLQVALRSMNIEGVELMRIKMSEFDRVLAPDIRGFGLFDFDRIGDLIEAGRREASAHIDEILKEAGRDFGEVRARK